jgi:hypothetical protein
MYIEGLATENVGTYYKPFKMFLSVYFSRVNTMTMHFFCFWQLHCNLLPGGIRTRDLLFCRRTRWSLCHATGAIPTMLIILQPFGIFCAPVFLMCCTKKSGNPVNVEYERWKAERQRPVRSRGWWNGGGRGVLVVVLGSSRGQRPILNFAPKGKLWRQGRSCPPGVNFVPWGWSYP